MKKAIKKTTIQFGLVSIPIKLTTLQTQEPISFHNICPYCKSQINYLKWCKNCNKEIKNEEMLKGFKISKSSGMVILTQEQIEKIKQEEDKGIEIIGFVKREEIPFFLYEKTYNVMPYEDKKNGNVMGLNSYLLFREALKLSGYCAIGKMIMKNKSYLVSITEYQDRLLLSVLYYPHRISFDEKVESKEIEQKALDLAVEYINKMSYLNWDTFYTEESLRDGFRDKVLEAISKALSKEREETRVEEEIKEFKDMVSAMVKSIEIADKKKKESKK